MTGALLDVRKAKDEKSINVEPLFILALKGLLDIKTNEWASKD
jgi:hypothetical protein